MPFDLTLSSSAKAALTEQLGLDHAAHVVALFTQTADAPYVDGIQLMAHAESSQEGLIAFGLPTDRTQLRAVHWRLEVEFIPRGHVPVDAIAVASGFVYSLSPAQQTMVHGGTLDFVGNGFVLMDSSGKVILPVQLPHVCPNGP